MKSVQWLFVVSALLFITGIGFVIAGAREARSAAPVAEPAPVGTPVATVKQIMAGITGPAATTVYNSVGTIVSAEGIKETAPQTDEEWASLAATAASLAESGNLLLTPGRAIDNADWVKMSQTFVEKSKLAIKAAEEKSTEGILSAGSEINETCDTCHERYRRQ
jgi:NAD/NADP transhydrogenase alpha subunit